MSEKQTLEDFPYRDYSKTPRVQISLVGSVSALRAFDPKDRRDLLRMRILDRATLDSMDPAVGNKWLNPDGSMIIKGIKKFMTDKAEGFSVAIVANEAHQRKQERGEVQGFAYIYPQEADLVSRMQECGQLDNSKQAYWEISWARKPEAKSGQIASGVRTFLGLIYRSMVTFQEEITESRVTKVSTEMPVNISTFIEEGNEESQRVATACGFDKRGKIVYSSDEQKEIMQAWILNWERLTQILHEKGDLFWKQRMIKPTK